MDGDKSKLNIELPAEIAEGTYSNFAIITHSATEFIVDFVRVMPGVQKANVKSRIILTPDHAKRLLKTLKENIEKYDSEYGSGNAGASFPIGFTSKSGQA